MSKFDEILQALPQTQCQLCKHKGCAPYAKALEKNEDSIEKCYPGGLNTLNNLAKILDISPAPYIDEVSNRKNPQTTISIDSDVCIGCTKCIQACPVDAISGTAKANHVVITTECTGCNLCIPVCPVDCMHIVEKEFLEDPMKQAQHYRARYESRNKRLNQQKTYKTKAHLKNKLLIKSKLSQLTKNKDHD